MRRPTTVIIGVIGAKITRICAPIAIRVLLKGLRADEGGGAVLALFTGRLAYLEPPRAAGAIATAAELGQARKIGLDFKIIWVLLIDQAVAICVTLRALQCVALAITILVVWHIDSHDL
jgi:hypothetical protein